MVKLSINKQGRNNMSEKQCKHENTNVLNGKPGELLLVCLQCYEVLDVEYIEVALCEQSLVS